MLVIFRMPFGRQLSLFKSFCNCPCNHYNIIFIDMSLFISDNSKPSGMSSHKWFKHSWSVEVHLLIYFKPLFPCVNICSFQTNSWILYQSMQPLYLSHQWSFRNLNSPFLFNNSPLPLDKPCFWVYGQLYLQNLCKTSFPLLIIYDVSISYNPKSKALHSFYLQLHLITVKRLYITIHYQF